ncbi:MAG: carbohydrate ABC transporter permease [Provencibacterium sp.]|jgi:putative aldouronate transport system permease protein|nr:carbohydrate ABC transporter permease [Provencibacterium sp.]
MKFFKRKSRGDAAFDLINGLLLGLIVLVVAYPLYFSLIASFSDPQAVYQGRVLLLPADVTLRGYQKIFSDQSIWTGYLNALFYTFTGTCLNLLFTIPLAFALSRSELPLCGVYMKLFTFTMYFYGGIIPLYFVVKQLKMLDTMWALILPTVVATYNLIIARSFFIGNIPEELREAAFLDGCGYLRFFFLVALPLSKALLAVMALFYGARHWNGYFEALIYLNTERKFPLQLVLRTILIDSQAALSMTEDATTVADKQQLVDLLKYGCVVVSSVPMLIVYPFVQKHFVKGVMIGAVKG